MATKNEIVNQIVALTASLHHDLTQEEVVQEKRRLHRENKAVLLARLEELGRVTGYGQSDTDTDADNDTGMPEQATRYDWPNPSCSKLWLMLEELGFQPGPLSHDLRAVYDDGEARWFNLYFEPETYKSPAHKAKCYHGLGLIRSQALARGWSANFSRDREGMGYLRIIRRY